MELRSASCPGTDMQTRPIANGAPNFKCPTLNTFGLHTLFSRGKRKLTKSSVVCMRMLNVWILWAVTSPICTPLIM